MPWEAAHQHWAKAEPMRLAYYVNPDVLRWFEGAINYDDLLGTPQGKARLIEAIYTSLCQRTLPINYAPEKFDYREAFQPIRHPEEVLGEHSPMGTCLDLSLVFCGLCLAHNLLPILIILDGHALVAVALDKSLPEWNGYRKGRNLFELEAVWERGLLTAQQPEQQFKQFKQLVEDGVFLAVECTGFAHSDRLGREVPPVPEGIGRQENSLLTFERAVEAGHEQLEQGNRPFQFALDIAVAQAYIDKPYLLDAPQRAAAVPFMVEDLPGDFIPRPREFKQLVAGLLDEQRERPIAITAALRGAGGYGKTTMARALCHDPRIRSAFRDGILWVMLGENLTPDKLIGKVEDLIYTLSHERPGFAGLEAATARLVELLGDRDQLLVIDDAWNAAHLKPFQQGGKRCSRLITTRDDSILPADAKRIEVDAMGQQEAVQLLSGGLNGGAHLARESEALRALAARLGEWPLLLKLANGVLREEVSKYQQALPEALVHINEALDECGLTVFDAADAQDRSQAVAKTLGVSMGLLRPEEQARYRELALFPKDVDIPLASLQKLWTATGGLGKVKTELLCKRLHGLSLLMNCDLGARTIRLHDVVRTYLRGGVGKEQLAILHGQFLDAYGLTHWADLPFDEPHLWEHLADHLLGASRGDELVATVKDGRYLTVKIHLRGVYSVEADLSAAERYAPADSALRMLNRRLSLISHLLTRCQTLEEVRIVLYVRLMQTPELANVYEPLEPNLPRPCIVPWHALPDLPDSALTRTLSGHTSEVNACAVNPTGNYIVSASSDKTLKVWDAYTGAERLDLRGHTGAVKWCAVSPTGDYIVSASSDRTLKVWDAYTGAEWLTLRGHTSEVNVCAVSPTGDYIVSASLDRTLKVWDAYTGAERLTLRGHTGAVKWCAVSPTGDYIVSASLDHKTLKVWDAHSGAKPFTFHGHTRWVYGCAVSPTGDYIVSASSDKTLKVWDAHTGAERLTLRGHTGAVKWCAVSSTGDYIVSASSDSTLKVWDAHTGAERLTLHVHTTEVDACAVSLIGDYIVSATKDKTLKVWDAHTGAERLTLRGHTSYVNACAVSPTGDYIVSASDDGTLKVWDAHTGAERLTLSGHTDAVLGCAVSPAGDIIVSASGDKTLKLWDAHTGAERLTLSGHISGVRECAVSPAGDVIVSASADRTLKVWDVHTGAERLTLSGHTDAVLGCAVSPAGDVIVSASDDMMLKLWDVHTGGCLAALHVDDRLRTCAFIPDGEHVVAGGDKGVYFLRLVW